MKYNKFLEDLEIIDQDHKNYSIETPLRVDAFEISDDTMNDWQTKFKNSEKQALYHYDSHEFNLPYDFALGNVKL